MRHLKIEVLPTQDELPETQQQPFQNQFVLSLRGLRFFVFSIFVTLVLLAGGLYFSLYRIASLEEAVSLQNANVLAQQTSLAQSMRGAAQQVKPSVPAYQDIRIADGTPMIGNSDAKVTIVEYADFQCPFCKRLFNETVHKLKTDYVDTGKAKFYYVDFAFLGQESKDAAEAAHCAADQGKYWEYHDTLYLNQTGENIGAFARKNLEQFARATKLNMLEFTSCLDSDKHVATVEANTNAGKGYGVRGTPAVFINGKLISGAQPYEVFQAVIEAELSK